MLIVSQKYGSSLGTLPRFNQSDRERALLLEPFGHARSKFSVDMLEDDDAGGKISRKFLEDGGDYAGTASRSANQNQGRPGMSKARF